MAAKLEKVRDELLAFCDFPTEHWKHIPLRRSLTTAQRRLHSLSGVFCGRSHEGGP